MYAFARAWAFSKVTSVFSMDWPMSLKCCLTAAPMSMRFRVAPRRPASSTALSRVRSVVPKQGMVTAMMSLAGRSSSFMATAVMRMARVESSPPDRPTTAAPAWVCSSRFFSPRAARRMISSQCSSRAASSSGIKGVGLTGRVRVVVPGSREKNVRPTPRQLMSFTGSRWGGVKVFIRRRS